MKNIKQNVINHGLFNKIGSKTYLIQVAEDVEITRDWRCCPSTHQWLGLIKYYGYRKILKYNEENK